MVLTSRLLLVGTARPHVLVVAVPGYRPVRWAAERFLLAAGWPAAASPAEADVLLVCGEPGPALSPRIDVAWSALPGPRARAMAVRPDDVETALLTARTVLRDEAAQRSDARDRAAPALGAGDGSGAMQHDMSGGGHEGHDMSGGGHEGHDMSGGGHEGHDMSGHDMSGHDMSGGDMSGGDMSGGDMSGGGHEGHDMSMDLPGGLSMADRADDRDGLKLDVLHLAWGPLLPGWPAGLQLDLVLQGDVLQEVTARGLDPAAEPPEDPRRVALDDVAAVLDAAGWQEGAVRARRLRDGDPTGPELAAFARRVRRARLLHWSLRALPGPGGCDIVEHLQHLLRQAAGEDRRVQTSSKELERVLTGLDLGTAAVVVAAYASCVQEAVSVDG